MSNFEIFSIIAVVAMITIALRVTPFIVMDKLSKNDYLQFIGQKMPVGVMILLVLYTFLHVDFTTPPYGAAYILAALVVLIIYGFSKNILISIAGGLFAHLFLVNIIFTS
ncbi:MAG: AzlD domain-containing protein [Acinetobacter sp.]